MSGRGFPISFALLRELTRFPGTLMGICLALLGISLVAVRSASLTPAGTFLPFMDRQLIWVGIGIVVFTVVAFLPYAKLGRRSAFFYLLISIAFWNYWDSNLFFDRVLSSALLVFTVLPFATIPLAVSWNRHR